MKVKDLILELEKFDGEKDVWVYRGAYLNHYSEPSNVYEADESDLSSYDNAKEGDIIIDWR